MKICDNFTPVQDDSHVCNTCDHKRMDHPDQIILTVKKPSKKDIKKTEVYEKMHTDAVKKDKEKEKLRAEIDEIMDELSQGMTVKDWADWDRSAKIARENRVRCNKMTKAEREASLAQGMRLIYGHKWTKAYPKTDGWYWIETKDDMPDIYRIHELAGEMWILFNRDKVISVKEFVKGRRVFFAGPLEKPT